MTNGKVSNNSSMKKSISLDEIVQLIKISLPPSNMRTRVIAIDGCGGAGKSTFANELSKHLSNCAVIHTDDFASWDNSASWYPRMVEQVLVPLRDNRRATYQRYDWKERKLANWIDVDLQPFVIIEGVSSSRKEFREFLSFSFWFFLALLYLI
jgi:uridine kinase